MPRRSPEDGIPDWREAALDAFLEEWKDGWRAPDPKVEAINRTAMLKKLYDLFRVWAR